MKGFLLLVKSLLGKNLVNLLPSKKLNAVRLKLPPEGNSDTELFESTTGSDSDVSEITSCIRRGDGDYEGLGFEQTSTNICKVLKDPRK